MRRLSGLLIAVVLSSACGILENPSAPTRSDVTTLTAWYPCVVVHAPGSRVSPEFQNQFNAIQKLQKSGRMEWIRLGSIHTPEYQAEARRLGLKIFSIIGTEDLERTGNWNQAFDIAYSRYQGDLWEITGEISNPAISNIILTPDYYMMKFKGLYNYVQKKYPGVVLVSAPTLGSASTPWNQVGPVEFQRFIELGLLDMDVVVAVNVYTEDALQQYAAIFSRYRSRLSTKRIWVTETGSSNPDEHVRWVENFYPKIISTLHPEMICWYALWDTDVAGNNGFGMLDKVSSPSPEERELFQVLTGGVK